MQLERFQLINLSQLFLDKYLKKLRLNIDLELNKGIILIPEYYDNLLTTVNTIDLAVESNPALIVFQTEFLCKPWSKNVTATEIVNHFTEVERFIQAYKPRLERYHFELYDTNADEETYVFGQFNFGLLKGELKCGT